MMRYLKRLDKNVLRSVKERTHFPNLTPIIEKTQSRLGGGATLSRPTVSDIYKIENDEIYKKPSKTCSKEHNKH